MSEVSCRATVPLIAALRQRGLALEPAVQGLPFSVEELESPSNRIPWDPFTILLERAADLLGGMHHLEETSQRHAADFVPGLVRILQLGRLSPRRLYVAGARWVGPWVFLGTQGTCEDLLDGRIRQTVEILPGYRPCSAFFHAMRGLLRAVPSLLGLPEAIVDMREDGRQGVYTITPPPVRTWPARLRRRLWRSERMPEDLAELGFQQEQLRESYQQVRRATVELREKSRMLETVDQLGRDLAQRTDLAELVDSVIRVLEERFHFGGIRISCKEPASEAFECLGESGERVGPPSRSHLLEMGGRELGRLDLWEGPCPRSGCPQSELLEGLLPWIAIGLENARSFEVLSQQTRRLEEEVTERRRAEKRLERLQRLDAMGRLTSGLAHDINNILTAIRGYADLASDSLDDGDPARGDLEGIEEMCDRAGGLVQKVLAFSREQVFVPRPLDLNASLRRVEPMLRRLIGEDIELLLELAEDAGAVMADPGQLEQVVVNLLTNSRDALPEGGRITIRTRGVRAPDREGKPASWVRLEVGDTGHGMDSSTRAQIFDPFFTTKEAGKGTGLGLASVAATIDQFGGTIGVESELDKGTTLSIQLPQIDASAVAEEMPGSQELAGGDETLLLVEDEEAVRRVTRRILEEQGYTVLEAPHGPGALAICEARQDPIDLLVTDIVMPGMDGRELARRIARLRPGVRGVVFLSGYSSEGIPSELPFAAEPTLLRKPFPSASLLAAVRRALNAAAAAEADG